MRIKITANKPIGANCSSINHLIGKEFHVLNDDMEIKADNHGTIGLFPVNMK